MHVAGTIRGRGRVVRRARHIRQARSRIVVVPVRQYRLQFGAVRAAEPYDESRGVHHVAGPLEELLQVVNVAHAGEVGAKLSGRLEHRRHHHSAGNLA